MKKLLIATAVTAVLSSSALAGTENMFYLKANAGATMLNKAKDKATGLKMKAKTSPVFGLGVGYYVMDNTRVDLSFDMPVSPQLKKTGNVDDVKNSVKHKGTIYALMVNGYVDLFDVSVAKVFVGAGVGVSQIKEKISLAKDDVANPQVSSKKATQVAYQLTLGTAAEVAPGVNAELSYSWKDYGKTKSKKVDNKEASKTSYKGHNVLVGVRFDI